MQSLCKLWYHCSLMPQDRQCLPYPHSTGPGPTRLGAGPPPRGRTPASDRWLNPSWTLSPGGTLNRPRGTSLERLSGWIRTTGGPPAHQARPAPTAAAYLPRRKATQMGATGTQYRLGRPTRVAPAVPVNLPAGQASGGPRGPRARLEPPRVRKARPSCGPLRYACGPGWQERQVAQTGSHFMPLHTH
jgi:hypothetical protein